METIKISEVEQINSLEYVIRQLHKIDSKLLAGQTILAWRSNRKLIAELEKTRNELTKELNNKNGLAITYSNTVVNKETI